MFLYDGDVRYVTTSERRALLADRHRLLPHRRTNDVATIADDLVALHSSDPATVFLSAFVRMADATADRVEHALYADRTLLRFHAMRRTIWVATPALVEAMNASSTRKIAAVERRQLLRFLAVTPDVDDPDEMLKLCTTELMALLHTTGPITTREIGTRRPDLARKITIGAGTHRSEAGAHTRVAALAAFEGALIRGRPTGTWVASEYTWHLLADWTSLDLETLTPREGAAIVLRSWLARFGPGTERDLRWWTGWTAAAVRTALADLGAIEVGLDQGMTGWVLPDDPLLDAPVDDADPWVAVLPGLDPTTMGWKDRSWYLDDAVAARVFDRNGNAGPTIWCNGRVVGGWAQRASGELAVELGHELTADETRLLDTELARLQTAIGDIRFRVRFPSPNQKSLFAT